MRRVVRVAAWELDVMSEAKEVSEAKARASERQQKMLRDGVARGAELRRAQESAAPAAAETATKREGKAKSASA